jgi:uncharacterized protein YyaL (SSP411 family)
VSSATPTTRPANRLSREKSPYLLQHQFNPVDWHAWNEEAFRRAHNEGKPVFLSIGYSTCHWCHVMERESFEDERVAALLNRHFISIKVDREERPDVDRIYMAAVQGMTGQGGWPLNLFLTPDLRPFYGGTYFPPEQRQGRISFLSLLEQIQNAWQNRRPEVEEAARDLHSQLAMHLALEPVAGLALTPAITRRAAEVLKSANDPRHGGFGRAPKFPQPSQPALLLRVACQDRDPQGLRMVWHQCERMAAGGIHDQLGGGFARYSVDEEWLVPHFEKMLYDNAQLLELYLDAWLTSDDERHAQTARGVVTYLRRDMTHPLGGFFSAEDADSEGKEGKFYCWTTPELATLLTPEEYNVARHYFGFTPEGNFVDHSDPDPLPHQNVLRVANPTVTAADAPLLQSAREKLLAAREKRVRPHLDDKILASWNGLMLGALARASAALAEPAWRAAAERNAAFLRQHLWHTATGTLRHRWRQGECDDVQLLDAYAFPLHGLIQLYEATLEPAHLDFALALAEAMRERFYDPEHGGFWQNHGAPELILRVKEDYDGAEPAGNSVAVSGLLRLAALTGRADYLAMAEKTLHLFADQLQRQPQKLPHMLLALDFWLHEPARLVIAGDPAAPATRALIQAAHQVYYPHKIVCGTAGPVAPEAKAQTLINGQPTAWLCTGTACQPPVTDPADLRALLASHAFGA